MLETPYPESAPERVADGAAEPLLKKKDGKAPRLKLHEEDTVFLNIPDGAVMVSSGVSGAESWIERDRDVTVRIVVQTVAIALEDDARLEAVIEVAGGSAKGEDGPAAEEAHLQALQSVQVLVKQGERMAFKAYPRATGAKVMRTVVYTADQK